MLASHSPPLHVRNRGTLRTTRGVAQWIPAREAPSLAASEARRKETKAGMVVSLQHDGVTVDEDIGAE